MYSFDPVTPITLDVSIILTSDTFINEDSKASKHEKSSTEVSSAETNLGQCRDLNSQPSNLHQVMLALTLPSSLSGCHSCLILVATSLWGTTAANQHPQLRLEITQLVSKTVGLHGFTYGPVLPRLPTTKNL